VALGFWCDEAVTRWVKTEVVAVVVVVAVAVAVQLFRSAAETHTYSAFRNSMCIVARRRFWAWPRRWPKRREPSCPVRSQSELTRDRTIA